MIRMLAVASAAPNRHNDNNVLITGDSLNNPVELKKVVRSYAAFACHIGY
jgi:hypothetical protein